MNTSIMLLVLAMPVVAMINLLSNNSHFLMTLLSLEGIMLTLVLFVPMTLNLINAPNVTVSVVMLTFGACEASLGLSLLVIMSRSCGTDMLKSLTMNKC